MKTNIRIRATYNGRNEVCRVKLDKNKFPYIVLGNEKMVINSVDFPRTVDFLYGLWKVKLEMVEGLDQLKEILANPDLTCDKLGLKQLGRVG